MREVDKWLIREKSNVIRPEYMACYDKGNKKLEIS
jgi:hypothetical protein